MFALLVTAAVACRRRTEWHRRLMLGATVILLEPAFGRLLPMPLLGALAEWTVMAVQLGFVLAIARHDLRRHGEIHGATVVIALAVVLAHGLMAALAVFPPFVALADSIAGAA